MTIRVLCFADLHFKSEGIPVSKRQWMQASISNEQPDVVVIAGDLSDTPLKQPYAAIQELVMGLPTVYCLGNHEFYHRTAEDTLEFHRQIEKPDKIHCLDVHGSMLFQKGDGKVRFIGNMFGYDGSLSDYKEQRIEDFAGGTWPDKYIDGWKSHWLIHHKECVVQIERGLNESKADETTFLITHTVPHYKLNAHKKPGEYNAFSGVKNFLEMYKFDYAVCGHTHMPVGKTVINGCACSNIGNDFNMPFRYCLFEI